MIHERIWIGVIVALSGAIIKMVLEALGKKNISEIINLIMGACIIVSLFSGFDKPNFDFSLFEENIEEKYYENLSKESYEEIYSGAEKEIEIIITESIRERYNVEVVNCEVEIDFETMKVKVNVYLISETQTLISPYEVKNFLNNKYEFDAEVVIL